jgi:hypothetical protein
VESEVDNAMAGIKIIMEAIAPLDLSRKLAEEASDSKVALPGNLPAGFPVAEPRATKGTNPKDNERPRL